MDAIVEGHGSVVLVRPLTPAAEDWLDENVQKDATWYGGALVCEPRFVLNLVAGMRESGLTVEAQ